jgi:hypothetical protein
MNEPTDAISLASPPDESEKIAPVDSGKPNGSSRFQEDATSDDVTYQHNTGAQAAKLQNVLHGLSKEQIFAEVDQFTLEHGLGEYNAIFRKGALLAQRPHEYQMLEELSQEDKDVIQYEHEHKWSHPWTLYYTGEPYHVSVWELLR